MMNMITNAVIDFILILGDYLCLRSLFNNSAQKKGNAHVLKD